MEAISSILKKKENRGGARPNSGPKKGTKHKETITREAVAEKVRSQIMGMASKLVRAQAIAAFPAHRMIIITETSDGKKIETVRDEDRMQELLDTGIVGKDYFIVEGRDGDWKAGNAMLDRALGKATESLKIGNEDGKPFIVKLD